MASPPGRVLVMAPNWLGDAVMALPAVQTLRDHLPHAQFIVAARPSVAPLYAMVPGVDTVVRLESRGGLAHLRQWRRDAERLADERVDLAVLLPNSFMSAWVVAQARIPERWGFATDLRGRYLTKALRRPARSVHQADYYLALTTAAGLVPSPRVARVVAIFGPTNERQTAPLPAALDAPPNRLAIHHVWCRPCMLRECPLGHMCMRGVSPDDVAALIP